IKGNAFQMKWLFVSLISLSAGIGAFSLFHNSKQKPNPITASVPAAIQKEQSDEFKNPESTLDTANQSKVFSDSKTQTFSEPAPLNNDLNEPFQAIELPPIEPPLQYEHMPYMPKLSMRTKE